MKRFTAIALAALMVLSFVSVASAADSVEIRSPVFNGSDIDNLDRYSTDFTDFAGFFFDLDDGIGSELMTIDNTTTGSADRTIGENGLIYTTDIQNVSYTYEGWENSPDNNEFDKMGFLAEEFVPVNGDPALLSKLIMDDDEKYTMRVGQSLDLGQGFVLTPKQIDVDGEKVWLELTKDGEFLDDDVYSTVVNPENKSWDYDQDVGDEDDVVVMRVHVNEVFQGQVDSLAVIEGLWLMDNEAMEIENEDTFGDLEVTSVSVGSDDNAGLTLKNADTTITLGKDDKIDITETLKIVVADNDDSALRFYFMEEITEPGTYEIRGTVAEPVADNKQNFIWNETSFAGFYYDLDDNVASEQLNITVSGNDNRTVAEDAVVYTTDIQEVSYTYEYWDTKFNKMGFLAEEFVPVNEDPALLSKLIMDDDEKYTMRVGQSLDLGEGFVLTPKQIDVDGEKVWLELTKDGEFLDDDVYSTVVNPENKSWDYDQDVGDEDDVVVMRVHVNEVFQGQVDSLAVIEGIWLMDNEAMEIENEDTFGDLEVTSVSVGSDDNAGLTLKNVDTTISLGEDDTIDLTDSMKIQVADSDVVRFYPFVEVTVEGEVDTGVEDVTPEDEVDEVVDENVTEVVDENVTEVVDENVTEVVEDEDEEEDEVPGFEAVFAIAGLLAVAYFVRRN